MNPRESLPHPQPCLTRINGVTCHGVLLPVTAREWRCTEGHTMWGSSALRSQPWPADRPHVPWFARLRARIFGRAKTVVFGSDARAVTIGDAGASSVSHATVGQASRSGSGGVTPGDEPS